MIHRDIVDIMPMNQFLKNASFYWGCCPCTYSEFRPRCLQAIEDAIILAECIKNNAHYRQAFIEYEQKDEIELKNLKHCVDSWKNGANRK